MTINERVGALVHHAMWEKRITQTMLAPLIGLTQPALSKKMRGERPWFVAEILWIAKVLHVPVGSLLPDVDTIADDCSDGGSVIGT